MPSIFNLDGKYQTNTILNANLVSDFWLHLAVTIESTRFNKIIVNEII